MQPIKPDHLRTGTPVHVEILGKRLLQKGELPCLPRIWDSRALAEKLSSIGWKRSLKDEINSITVFERQSSDSGAIILKFFLHISKDDKIQATWSGRGTRSTARSCDIQQSPRRFPSQLRQRSSNVLMNSLKKLETHYVPGMSSNQLTGSIPFSAVYSDPQTPSKKELLLKQKSWSKKARQKSHFKPPKNPVPRKSSASGLVSNKILLINAQQPADRDVFARSITCSLNGKFRSSLSMRDGMWPGKKEKHHPSRPININPLAGYGDHSLAAPNDATRKSTITYGGLSVITRKPGISQLFTGKGTGCVLVGMCGRVFCPETEWGRGNQEMPCTRTMSIAMAGNPKFAA